MTLLMLVLILISNCSLLILLNIKLKTRYVMLHNRSTGQWVEFMGVMHAGTLLYYNHVCSNLRKNDSVVLYEAVRDQDGLAPILKSYKLIARLLNIYFQGEAVNYHSDWILSDINMKQLEKCIDMYDIHKQDTLIEKWIVKKEKSKHPIILECLYQKIIEIVCIFNLIFPYDPLITVRNIKPIQDAELLLAQGKRPCIFYGDAHYKGIVGYFLKRGFEIVLKKRYIVFE